MIEIIDKLEELIKTHASNGIVGWIKHYKPTRYPAYCIEPNSNSIEHEYVDEVKESPVLKLCYIENFVNADYNADSKAFFQTCSDIESVFKNNKTLDNLVSEFKMKTKYSTRQGGKGLENVMEISLSIDEIM